MLSLVYGFNKGNVWHQFFTGIFFKSSYSYKMTDKLTEIEQHIDKLSLLNSPRRFKKAKASEEEVAQIESDLGFKLPSFYRAFLLEYGNSTGDLFFDIAVISDFKEYQEFDSEFRKKEGYPIRSTEVVIISNLEYAEYYFDLLDGDDPSVYLLMSCQWPPESDMDTMITSGKHARSGISNTLSNFIAEYIRVHVCFVNDLSY